MAVKLLNTILISMLFLLAFLLVIRMIRTDEGFQNQPEEYDLNLFFNDYPLQKICEIYAKGFPTVVNSFSLTENGDKVPESVAKINAEDYLKKTLIGGIASCPFTLPKDPSLKAAFDFVSQLDETVLTKGMSTLLFFTANLQLSADTTKAQLKKTEGFISECSADEIQYKEFVPLQCIPPETMKATEQAEINNVDKFEMQQRVSQKAQISKKLGTMVQNLQAFQKQFGEFNKLDIQKYTANVQKWQVQYEIWNNPSEITKKFNSQEKIQEKKQQAKSELDKNKNNLAMAQYYSKFSSYTMKQLVETYMRLRQEVEGVANELEKGIPGAPKT
jgi:hypothetical protein